MKKQIIKKDFPILNKLTNGKSLVYLDNAATSQKPISVINAIQEFYNNYNANVHRGVYKISEEATIAYELAHQKTAKLINASQEEMIFTKNTTESINLLAYSFQNSSLLNNDLIKLRKGDEIVVSLMEHHSNFVPWQQLAKRLGLHLKILQIDKEGKLIIDEKLFTDKTKIVAVTHASNALGTINDITQITKLAHEKNAFMVVDGAQSVPNMPVDIKSIGCDFLAFSGHKMMASTGIGCLYGKRKLLEEMQPFLFGGDMIRTVDVNETAWNDLPWKFEAGTPPIAEGISMSFAVDYLNKIGVENIREHEIKLTQYTMEEMNKIPKLNLLGPKDANEKSGIISFNLENIHPHDVASVLDNDNIAIRGGNHCAMPLMKHFGVNGTSRASFYLYNDIDDADKLIESLKKTIKLFS